MSLSYRGVFISQSPPQFLSIGTNIHCGQQVKEIPKLLPGPIKKHWWNPNKPINLKQTRLKNRKFYQKPLKNPFALSDKPV